MTLPAVLAYLHAIHVENLNNNDISMMTAVAVCTSLVGQICNMHALVSDLL